MLKSRILLALSVSILAALPATAANFTDYHVVAVTERQAGPLTVTEETVQVGEDPIARFTIHRMTKRQDAAASRGAFLLMPGGASNFDFYAADENGKELRSFAAFFALRGFDVWGYSPRTRGLAPGACTGGVDCSGMRSWGMQSVVNDALYIREKIRGVYGARKPGIAGLSLGAMSALATMNASPQDWAGAVIWEGMIYSEAPVVLAANAAVCTQVEAQLVAGVLWDDANYPVIRQLYALAVEAPDGPSPVPGFEGLTNHQVLVALFSTPQPAPPGYVPGYTLVAGNVAQDRFFYSTDERLAMLILQLNHYEPMALIRDYTCALGGERTFSGNLPQFTAPVYVIGGGHSFGRWMRDNVELLGSADVTWNYIPAFAHADHIGSPEHRRLLERPLLHWLRRVLAD
jgi:pimeloyl-ACP methyl ester carboxylesterase